jgi:tRNA pseudouridine13 synthase
MKIKVRPEDFVVQELATLKVSDRVQAWQIFRLIKTEWDTFDLVDLLSRRLKIPKKDIRFGGIKDRFAHTEQLISIRNRGRQPQAIEAEARDKRFNLTLVGYSPAPMSARSVRSNRFTVTIRSIHQADLERYVYNAGLVSRWGLPNYYDEQRFGSARHGQGFMGREIFLGRREEALRLFFQPCGHDDRKSRALKSCVVQNWGNWRHCLPLAFGEYRRILAYLSEHQRAFHRALSLIDRRFLLFVLNAYQSLLFNRILSEYLTVFGAEHGLQLDRHVYRWGTFLFFKELSEGLVRRLKETTLPVPGWDSRIRDPVVQRITSTVLEQEGIELRDLKIRQMSGMYVNGIERPALMVPENFNVVDIEDDELYENKKKMTLEFSLPRGGYATLVLKRLCAGGNVEGGR